MAGIEDFLKKRWTVTTRVPNGLAKFLPAKNSAFRFEVEKGSALCMVVTRARSEKRFGGFTYKDGRLERKILGRTLVIEIAKASRGKVQLRGWLQGDNASMTSTWGAESGGGGGGGNTYPNNTGAGAS